jgi:MFS family permease
MFASRVDQPVAPPVLPATTNLNKVLWLVGAAFFMESLDTTILNTAVPTVAAALKVPPLSMKSVLASYTLSLAVFIPISGWMADRFGTRRVFASAIGLFTIGSLLCGLTSDIRVLVACRILQGCGGAMMVPVGRLTLLRTFAKSELIRAVGLVQIPGLIGPILGPIVGGVIVGYLHWRMIFFVNIPIGVPRQNACAPKNQQHTRRAREAVCYNSPPCSTCFCSGSACSLGSSGRAALCYARISSFASNSSF